MTQHTSPETSSTAQSLERHERASHLDYGKKAQLILQEVDMIDAPEDVTRVIDKVLEEIEHDLVEMPMEGSEGDYDYEDYMNRLSGFVEFSNDPRKLEEGKIDVYTFIPSARGIRKVFTTFGSDERTVNRLLDAAAARVRLYELEQQENADLSEELGHDALEAAGIYKP